MPLGTSQMTTTTGNVFRPEVWSPEVLRAAENALVMAPLVKRFDSLVTQKGDTINIPNLSNLTASSKSANTQVTLSLKRAWGVVKFDLNIWNPNWGIRGKNLYINLTQVDTFTILEIMKNLSVAQKAWVAGIIDGEGALMIGFRPAQTQSNERAKWGTIKEQKYLRKTDSHIPIVSMTHTQIKLLNLFKSWFGGSIRISRAQSYDKKWKTLYQWKLNNGSGLKEFIELIQPYLFLKRRNAQLILELVSTFNKYGQSYPPPSKEILEKRQKIYEEMRQLNRRGVQPQRLSDQSEKGFSQTIVQTNES